MSEEGLKHHLNSIQHESFLHTKYQGDLSIKSIENSKQIIINAFKKQQEEIYRLKENRDIALEELKRLQRIINPPSISSIELQFNSITNWLKEE